MNAPRAPHALRARGLPCLLLLGVVTASLDAQPPVLAPTADTTIVVPSGPLHYSAIAIPAGVTVRFVTPMVWPIPFTPAVVLCDGDAIVHGTISVGGDIRNGYGTPAGWVTTGAGSYGWGCGLPPYGLPGSSYSPPHGGSHAGPYIRKFLHSHAGTYGSVVPFSLEGGSPGGALAEYDQWCWQWVQTYPGGPGGGTLALLADGRIEVHGTVTADGWHDGISSGGSGGSILLRGDAGVCVLSGGSVTARGGVGVGSSAPPPITNGAPGYVRLDAWAAPPVIQGTVMPETVALELPYLNQASTPRIGRTWLLDVYAPVNTPVFVSASLQAGPGRATRYGVLGIDPATSRGIGYAVTQPWPADTGHDPRAEIRLPVPDMPALIGLQLWVQGLAVPPTLPPRLTNTLAVTVQ